MVPKIKLQSQETIECKPKVNPKQSEEIYTELGMKQEKDLPKIQEAIEQQLEESRTLIKCDRNNEEKESNQENMNDLKEFSSGLNFYENDVIDSNIN